MTSCRKRCCDAFLWHTVFIVLLCSCTVTLLAVGFGVVAPYSYTRQFGGRQAICTVRMHLHHPSVTCHCGYQGLKSPSCRSTSPCVEIRVDYVRSENSRVVRDAMLYDDPYMYGVLTKKQCSTQPCEKDALSNNQTVDEFIRNKGAIGQTFICYPGRDSDPEVLMSLIEDWRVYVGMVTPGVLFLAAAIAEACYLFVYLRHRKTGRKQKERNSAYVDSEEC